MLKAASTYARTKVSTVTQMFTLVAACVQMVSIAKVYGHFTDIRAVNQFAVLDPDVSVPSTPPHTDSTFTFSYPPSTHNDAPALTALPQLPTPPPVTPSKLVLRRCQWPIRSQEEIVQTYKSPSPPRQTPTPIRPVVKLPKPSYSVNGEVTPEAQRSSVPNYLGGVRIPSPLLYHRRSREQMLAKSSDEDISNEIAKSFWREFGQEKPQPDFVSYKAGEASPEPQTEDAPTFSPAMLPLMGSSLTQSNDAASWGSEDSIRSWMSRYSSHGDNYPTPPPIKTTTNTISCVIPDRCRRLPFPTKRLGSCDFIFPELSLSGKSPNNSSLSGRTQGRAFLDDNADTIERAWKRFEEAVQMRQSTSPLLDILKPWNQSSSYFNSNLATLVDVSACPTPSCMAVVPARLYERQYLGWPRRQQEGNQVDMVPVASTSSPEDVEAEKIQEMIVWLKDFGFEDKHETDCPVAAGISLPWSTDLLDFSDAEGVEVVPDERLGVEAAPIEQSASPTLIDGEDEGYFTCGEVENDGFEIARTIEVDAGDEWDWVVDLESQLIEKKHGDWDDSAAW